MTVADDDPEHTDSDDGDRRHHEEQLDESERDSFPASDAPSSWAGADVKGMDPHPRESAEDAEAEDGDPDA